jgi:hypothetical protein
MSLVINFNKEHSVSFLDSYAYGDDTLIITVNFSNLMIRLIENNEDCC